MKKLICALVLLAMLVPVAAMAAVPEVQPSLDVSSIKDNASVTFEFSDRENKSGSSAVLKYTASERVGDKDVRVYEAEYYMSGELQRVRRFYDCGCVATFAPDGTVLEEPWCDGMHDVPVALTINGIVKPKVNISGYAPGYSNADALLNAVTNGTAQEIKNKEGQVLKSFGNGLYAGYYNNELKGIFIGSVVYDLVNDNGQLRMQGDPNNSVHTWGIYDKDTGALDHYGIFSKDRSLESVYDWKNRLKSYEHWDANGDYWGYFKEEDGWRFGEDYDHSTPGVTPTEDVLKAILLAPGAAVFDGAKSSSINAVTQEDVGTPVVIADADEVISVVATMDEYNKSTYQMNVADGELDETIQLLLPYSAGQNQELAKSFTYRVAHEYEDGKFIDYSTEPTKASEITAEFTDKGILISGVSSFSPFTVEWGPKQASTVGMDSLPSTGDSSNLLAYACLLLASAAMFVMLKRRAHQ